MCYNALYVDDVRDIPDDTDEYRWTIARNGIEGLFKLSIIEFDLVSLDHDLATFLGYKEITGYDIAVWLAERKQSGLYVPKKIMCHSANPVGVENIESVIARYLS